MNTSKPSGSAQASALERLASAITYLQSAGLRVRAGNDPQLGLVLAIDGARMVADSFGVMGFEPIPVASNASTPSGVVASTG